MEEEWWERPTCWICNYGWMLLLLLLLLLLLFFTRRMWGPYVGIYQESDLALSSSVDRADVLVDDEVTIEMTVLNNGPHNATAVQIASQPSGGLSIEQTSPTQGSYDPASGIWLVGDIPVGGRATMTIQAIAKDEGELVHASAASVEKQEDTDPTNNRAELVVLAHKEADLSLSSDVNLETVTVGDQVSFTITLTNNGPHEATGVRVSSEEPSGLTLIEATPSQGTFDPEAGEWLAGGLQAGESATIDITASVDEEGRMVESAVIVNSDQADPDEAGNSAQSSLLAEAPLGTGDVQVTLVWNDRNDLDLHVIDPAGDEIYYSQKNSESGGELDIDSNAGCGRNMTNRPVENIFWPLGEAPLGEYQVIVNYFSQCTNTESTPYTVHLLVDGVEETFRGEIGELERRKTITEFTR